MTAILEVLEYLADSLREHGLRMTARDLLLILVFWVVGGAGFLAWAFVRRAVATSG